MAGGKTIQNPQGAYGYSDLQTKLGQFVVSAKTSAAISTVPAVVAFGTDGTVATAATDGTASLARGVVLEAAESGDSVNVIVGGIAENVPVDGATAAGSVLKRSVTTAGRLAATATPAAGESLAIALAASASNTTDVWVCGLGISV